MNSEQSSRTLYRIVRHNPPTHDDFRSYEALGITLARHQPEAMRLLTGISLYSTLQQARNQATKRPRLGGFIAELHITPDAPVRIERTTPSRGHHTAWGSPDAILACVTRVVPVTEDTTGEAR